MSGLIPRRFKDKRRYSFPHTFGTTTDLYPIDVDTNLSNFDQNKPNSVTGDPALYNGCTAFSRADIATNEDKIIYKPGFTYRKSCLIAGVPEGSALPMESAFKSGIVYGLQAVGETTDAQALEHRRGPYFEVHPINNQDWFDALWSALLKGKRGISVGTPWFPELTIASTVGDVAMRPTDDWHCWEALAVSTGTPMMKVKAHTGDIKWFSRLAINKLLSVSGTDALTDTHGKALPEDIQLVQLDIRQVMLNYCYRAVALLQAFLKK